MSGAPARSRSVTLASLAASSASVIACRNRRRPFSVNVARHGSPASSGEYTRIPHSTSTTTRAAATGSCKPELAVRSPGYAMRAVW